MRRLGLTAFIALAGLTVGAFFVTQALKVSLPLINGFPAPVPSAINPISGGVCRLRNPKGRLIPVSFRRMSISFYLQNQGDHVTVTIINAAGQTVAVLPGSGRYLRTGHRHRYVWDGRERSGRVAPDGVYEIDVTLAQQDRTVTIADPSGHPRTVTVQTRPPRLTVTSVSPTVVSPAGAGVSIRFTGNEGRRPRVFILRLGRGAPRPVKSYAATAVAGHSRWNVTVAGGRPAPPGRYLVALRLTDRTCNTIRTPQSAAAAPQAVVTVR